MEKYSQDDQASIMATLQVVQSKGWSSSDSDPMQFHIILGEKIRYLEEQLIEHNYAMEEMEQKDKTIRDLKANLEHKRNIVENLEEEINKKDGEQEELQKDHDSKQTIFENLEMFVRDRIEEINELRKNNISLGNQIADGFLMEKKISIQKNVIENLNEKLKMRQSNEKIDESKEIEELMRDAEKLIKENKQKEILLKNVRDENQTLQKQLKHFEEANKFEKDDQIKENETLAAELIMLMKQNFKCVECEQTFLTKSNLENHVQRIHEANLLKIKLKELELKICQQRLGLVTKLFHLKENESKSKSSCRCRGWCGINHIKHGWKKSTGNELQNKFRHVISVNETKESHGI